MWHLEGVGAQSTRIILHPRSGDPNQLMTIDYSKDKLKFAMAGKSFINKIGASKELEEYLFNLKLASYEDIKKMPNEFKAVYLNSRLLNSTIFIVYYSIRIYITNMYSLLFLIFNISIFFSSLLSSPRWAQGKFQRFLLVLPIIISRSFFIVFNLLNSISTSQ